MLERKARCSDTCQTSEKPTVITANANHVMLLHAHWMLGWHPASPLLLILIDQLSALRSTASSLGHLSLLARLCAVSQGDGPKHMEGIKTAVSPADP